MVDQVLIQEVSTRLHRHVEHLWFGRCRRISGALGGSRSRRKGRCLEADVSPSFLVLLVETNPMFFFDFFHARL